MLRLKLLGHRKTFEIILSYLEIFPKILRITGIVEKHTANQIELICQQFKHAIERDKLTSPLMTKE